jgi:hypothetical protein
MIFVQDQGLTFVRCGHAGSILLAWNMSWSTYVFATKLIDDKECGDGKDELQYVEADDLLTF